MRLKTCLILLAMGNSAFAGEEVIDASSFKGDWPFVASKGVLKCVFASGGKGKIVTFKTTAGEYAVNGTANSHGFAELDPMWLDNEEIPGAKISVSDVIEYGLSLCK